MEQKHVLLSALAVGVGLGVKNWIGGWNPNEISEGEIVIELMNLIIHEKDTQVKFIDFPYYLR